MAIKKTPPKVLSERALELIMINVLGGLENTALQSIDPPQSCNGVNDCAEDTARQEQDAGLSLRLDSADLIRQKTDQKLNS